VFRSHAPLLREPRRFPPPWSVDDPDMKLGQECYIIRDANGRSALGGELIYRLRAPGPARPLRSIR